MYKGGEAKSRHRVASKSVEKLKKYILSGNTPRAPREKKREEAHPVCKKRRSRLSYIGHLQKDKK